MPDTIFLTGASGFIGSHLAERFAADGHRVRALVRADARHLDRAPAHLAARIERVTGDLSRPESLAAALDGVTAVVHVAGLTRAPGAGPAADAAFEAANVTATTRLLDAVTDRAPDVRRVVVTSSLAAVGRGDGSRVADESTPLAPISRYGASKARMEAAVTPYAGRLPLTIVRPPAVYGPRESDILTFFRTAARGLCPVVGDASEPVLTLVHVDDLVDGYALALAHPAAVGQTYFLGTVRARLVGGGARRDGGGARAAGRDGPHPQSARRAHRHRRRGARAARRAVPAAQPRKGARTARRGHRLRFGESDARDRLRAARRARRRHRGDDRVVPAGGMDVAVRTGQRRARIRRWRRVQRGILPRWGTLPDDFWRPNLPTSVSTLGYNTGIIEDYYKQYLDNPDSVSPSWREFFAGYSPDASVATPAQRAAPTAPAAPVPVVVAAPAPASGPANGAAANAAPATPAPAAKVPASPAGGDGASAPPDDGATRSVIRGAASKIVENMEASLSVPVATSVRTFPVKMMSENRRLINDHQKLVGGVKVSFTHLIAHAIALALNAYPSVNAVYEDNDGTPTLVQPAHVNLGLAIDLEKRGRRTLVVPSIKGAETLSFAQFLAAYNDIVRRARDGALTLDDFAGTTASITNPGMIGTTLSVPRLMPGQAVIVGVGSIGYPPEFYAMPPDVASRAGYSEVMTLTSTYDHRVIQGAESGAFLAHLVNLLLGQDGFYETVFRSLGVVYPPFRHAPDTAPAVAGAWAAADEQRAFVQKQARVLQLIRAYRVRGHLQADVNPLGYEWRAHPELDIAHYDLSVWDLDRVFLTGGLDGKEEMPLRQILDVLRETYTRKVGVEFMHITSVEEKRWLIERVEGTRVAATLTVDEKKRILDRLNAAEAFETFLHTKYVGQKRFSLQGADATIPFLDATLTAAAEAGVREAVMGMAHRGRLNVLANVLGKSFEAIFGEFEGHIDPTSMHGSGDVKYHLGMTGTHHAPGGQTVELMLAANPSHLETVDPIVEGMARARQDVLRENGSPDDPAQDAVLPILLHGDAAFAGQGVVPETLNMSQLRGYRTGGTVHLVVNNQIGFTTVPADSAARRPTRPMSRG